jgi:hypothetical protein
MAKNDGGCKLQGLLRRNSQRKKYKIRYGKTISKADHKQDAYNVPVSRNQQRRR